ncbi:MAG: decarboxylating 6-phosphogluconate dehydrogenase [Spirochaetia bacterium]|nr:decarboxylating 6-phosphogluconate dehydrogenase [Spirochaetia bacterium]
MQIGMIGLGRMGLNMSKRLKQAGHEVFVFDRNTERTQTLCKDGCRGAPTAKELVDMMKPPRVIWLMLPAGEVTDAKLKLLFPLLSKGDIIIDGGNSYYKEDRVREELFRQRGIIYMDAGVSGGVWGLKNGYSVMVGGSTEAFSQIEPVLKSLAPAGGYMYCGGPGAGHYVKMVHNAIEYGMMEAYAEGFELLKTSDYGGDIDMSKVASTWNNGSVVKSWLLELLVNVFNNKEELEKIQGYVEDSGEARWAVSEAVEKGVAADVITASLYKRFGSRQEDAYSNRILAALRREFGGHSVARNGEDAKKGTPGAGEAKHSRADK